jgi:hypothetical protein
MQTAEMQVGKDFLRCVLARFEQQKALGDRAIAQLDFAALRRPLDANTNSIAVIMKHVAGNLLSRWTDFLTTDGEKPDRHRDAEFVDDFASRDELLQHWERGWVRLFETMRCLTPADLPKAVFIRGDAHTVIEAILRATDHNGYHVGQIVQLARHRAGDKWEALSVPRGQSEEYNRTAWGPVGRPPVVRRSSGRVARG